MIVKPHRRHRQRHRSNGALHAGYDLAQINQDGRSEQAKRACQFHPMHNARHRRGDGR